MKGKYSKQRAIRREEINIWIGKGWNLSGIKQKVRLWELFHKKQVKQ